MPSLVGSLYVSLTADYSQYQRNMRQAEAVTARTTSGIRRSMGVTERSVGSLQRTMHSGIRPGALIAAGRSFDSVASRANLLRGSVFALTAAFGGLGAALTTNVISRYLDSFTGMENQIRVVSEGTADLAANLNAVSGVAQRSRSSLQAVGTLFSRLQKAQPGTSISTTLRRVETINKALQLGGATAQEASSAAIQFSQAIASNRLGGEELRAVLETPLGLELAKGLGVTIGKLREMGYAGELTAEKVTGALDAIAGAIDTQFARSVITIDQALTVADGKITMFAGRLDDTYGITKLLAGGILGLANNLESIVPALASLGIGLGSAFAGRMAGGAFGRRIAAIRAENAQRKESVRLAGEEAKATRLVADEAAKQVRAVSQKSASDFASPGAMKAYQRDLGAIQKLDKERLGLLDQQRNLTRQLGTVSVSTTAGAVRAADALATAHGKVNDQLSKRWSIQAQLTKTEKQIANLPRAGVAPNWLFPADVDAKERDLVTRRTKLASQLAQIDSRLGKDREALAQRQIRVTELTTEAERRAATERANILVREQQTRAALERNQARRGVFGSSLRASGAAVQASGGLGLAGAQLDAASTLIKTEQAAGRAARSLAAAANAARFTRQAFSLMSAAGGSLVGFLGGPWGVAFTVAIAAVTLLGVRTRKSAEEIARARAIISEELGNLEASGAPTSTEQRLAILNDKIRTESERLRDLTARLEGIRNEITNGLSTNLARQTSLSQGQFFAQYTALAEQFREGNVTVDQFINKLQTLGLSASAIDSVTEGMSEAIREGRSAEQVLELIRKRIADLDGQVAKVRIEVTTAPANLAGIGSPGNLGNFQQIRQRSQYGAGQNAARDQMELIKLRSEIMAAAGEVDATVNSPAKIRARTEALLELGGGYGLSRSEAEKLAAEELNLAEKTRLSAQSAKSATTDYENFANKLEELQQRAAASGLSDLDQDVVKFAEKLKNGSSLMKQYVDAINSGDLSKAPADLLKVRDALIQIEANSAADGILQKYGTAAQLAGVFAEKQAILNQAVMSGKITAEQAAIAYGEYLSTFGEYEWVNDLSAAVTGFAQSAVTDFDNVGDALKKLAQDIVNLIIQMTILKPLQNAIMGFVGGGAAGVFPTGPGGVAGTGVVGSILDVLHSGTGNAQPGAGAQRFVPSSAMRNARRFHSGIKSFEMGAVLKKGEAVLNDQQQNHAAGVIGGLANAVRGGRGSNDAARILVGIDPKNGNVTAYVEDIATQKSTAAVRAYDRTSGVRLPRDLKDAKRRGTA